MDFKGYKKLLDSKYFMPNEPFQERNETASMLSMDSKTMKMALSTI